MSKDMIRLMQVLFLPGMEACQEAPWRPNTDIHRTAQGWLVKFELAGVCPEDIDLRAGGVYLTLRGVRRDWCSSQAGRCYQMEIAYSHFERTLEFPHDLEQADITTEYRDGMLLVRITPAGEGQRGDQS